MDLAGPFVSSKDGGYKYIMVFVDDCTRYRSVYFLTHKSLAYVALRKFVADHRCFGDIKLLHGDRAANLRLENFS